MSDWISVNDILPDNEKYEKFEVKTIVGSMSTEEVETVLLGKKYATGFRFSTMDWQRVTHYRPFKPEGE